MTNRDILILSAISRERLTANETIEKIRKNDFESGLYRKEIHFYTHLNKKFDTLKKAGMLFQVGYKKGPGNRDEKMWILTKKAQTILMSISSSEYSEAAA